tara:strand:+ start:227 stop:1231 length:1005 start_codon:yes stop_codon:yes gene_type:complete
MATPSSSSVPLYPAYPLNVQEQYVTTIMGICSVFGSAIIIIAYAVVDQSPTTLWRNLMIFLSIFDMQQGFYYISVGLFNYTDVGKITPLCTAIGLSNIYSTTASYLCTGCIAFLVNDIVKATPVVKNGRYIYLIFLGYPLLVSVAVFVLHMVGKEPVITPDTDQYGCYINQSHELERWIASYIPMLSSWVVCSIYNLQAYRRLKQVVTPGSDVTENNGNRVIHNMMRRLLIVPFGFVLLRLPDISYRILELFYREQNVNEMQIADWFVFLQAGLNPAQGVWNCVLLAIYSRRLRRGFLEWCCCNCRKKKDVERKLIGSQNPYYSNPPEDDNDFR